MAGCESPHPSTAGSTGATPNNHDKEIEMHENDVTDNDRPESEPRPEPVDQTPDPFDPESLRISQDFGADLGVRKALLTVPVRKPSKEWWVRTHPDESYRLSVGVIELKEEREIYLVSPKLHAELATESTFGARVLITAINRQGVVFLLPVRLPGPDGRTDTWSQSALAAADAARTQWVRVQANMSLGAYEVATSDAGIPDPVWPEEDFKSLLKIAFTRSLHQSHRPSGTAAAQGGTMTRLDDFREVWLVDFEFTQPSGERPNPICLVARELRSNRVIRLVDEQLIRDTPPYPTDPDSLFVAYYASAELGGATWPLDGPCRCASSTSTPSSVARRRGFRFRLVAAFSVHWWHTAWMPSRPQRKRTCGSSPCGVVRTARLSTSRCSTTARAMSTPWRGCYRRCCPESTCPAHCSVGDTWRRPPAWNGLVRRSTCHYSNGFAITGRSSNGN